MNDEVRAEVLQLARILTDPDTTKAALETRVLALEGNDLPKVIIRAREVQAFAKYVIDAGEQEMRVRAIAKPTDPELRVTDAPPVSIGGTWVDRGTGVVHKFEGELGEWKVADPRGLRSALATPLRPDGSRFLTDADIDRAVPVTYKPDHRVLNEYEKVDPALRIVIADFREKTRGPAHLKEAKP